jgi:hypothetical protein
LSITEVLFAGLILFIGILGWFALLLAEIGWFGPVPLILCGAVILLSLAYLFYRARSRLLLIERANRLELLVLGGWLIAAGWLFFRPHEAVQGGADAGVYVNLAANIAQTGKIVYDDAFIEELSPAHYPTFMRERPPQDGTQYYLFPGFNLDDDIPGRVIPDFYPLHPVWQAVGYALGGIGATLRLTGLWALLGALALYMTLRQASSWPGALVGLAAISLCALQVWFARYPVAETLTQFLLWSSLWATGAWLSGRRPAGLWAFLAALTLGELFLVRIDTLFLLAIPAGIGLWMIFGRGKNLRPSRAWYFGLLLVLIVHALLHAALISTPYAERLINFALRTLDQTGLAIPLILALLLALVVGVIYIYYRERLEHAWTKHRHTLLWAATSLVIFLALFGWFVRPVIGQVRTYPDWYGGGTIFVYDHENLVRLDWYLSPLGVWLGVAGICLLLWKVNRKTIAVLGVGLFFSLLYLWRMQNNPVQIYAMRRYVPVVMPFFIFAGAFCLGWLGQRQKTWLKVGSGLLALLWLAGFAWSALGFISQVDYPGLTGDFQALDAQLAENAILLFNDQSAVSVGDIIGTPLHYQYSHDVLTLRDPAGIPADELQTLLRSWQESGREVYWIGDPAFLQEQGLAYTYSQILIPAVFLETPYDRKPSGLVESYWTLDIYQLQKDNDV